MNASTCANDGNTPLRTCSGACTYTACVHNKMTRLVSDNSIVLCTAIRRVISTQQRIVSVDIIQKGETSLYVYNNCNTKLRTMCAYPQFLQNRTRPYMLYFAA